MSRNTKFLLMFALVPFVASFPLALLSLAIHSALGIEADASALLNKSFNYVAGIVVGAWMWGADA